LIVTTSPAAALGASSRATLIFVIARFLSYSLSFSIALIRATFADVKSATIFAVVARYAFSASLEAAMSKFLTPASTFYFVTKDIGAIV
jgi:hypothetical protein